MRCIRGIRDSMGKVGFRAFVLGLLLMLFAFGYAGYATAAVPSCSWDKPGHNPYRGDVPSAVDKYTDIPAPVRARLKSRMQARDYDDVATIKRDSIYSKDAAYTDLRQMHFGRGQVCTKVSRAKWSETHEERGLVYCETTAKADYCVIVPTVCNNVSRIDIVPPLMFDPPAAGVVPPATFRNPVPPGGDFSFPPPTETSYDPPRTFRQGFPPSPFWATPFGFPSGSGAPPSVDRPPVGIPPVVAPPTTPSTTTPPDVPPVNPPVDPPVVPPPVPPTTTPPAPPPTEPPPAPPVTPPVTPPPIDPPVLPPAPPVSPPVPEPQTYAMILAGLGLIRYATRKTRR